ncbi:MAG: PGL/p-HBAD biosynthesis glycosyltransferase [Chlamydiae bacterium]|nr:PGL/p-HBAD biosynthesis glycosyltransferase [Chlamydiota bacterium]
MQFSIITITYNAEKYLRDTLSSVANQNFKDYEHLIWDGGSQDRTFEIIADFPHMKVHEGSDEGIADAMNQGAAKAKGEYLLFLHADDLLAHPGTLALISTSLKQHPEAEWLYGQAHVINSEGEQLRTTRFIPFDHRRLKKYNMITHPATVVSRELFERVGGFQKSLRYCMDYDLWLRLAPLATPFSLPAVIASFREHQNSLSTSEPIAVADEAYRVRNNYVTSPWGRWKSYRTWKKRRAQS